MTKRVRGSEKYLLGGLFFAATWRSIRRLRSRDGIPGFLDNPPASASLAMYFFEAR
jgi:hypothetical protein